MNIETSNDGQGQLQSWRASGSITGQVRNQNWNVDLRGYGLTEKKALINLGLAARSAVDQIISELGLTYTSQ